VVALPIAVARRHNRLNFPLDVPHKLTQLPLADSPVYGRIHGDHDPALRLNAHSRNI
jgi:hypothetical protein